MALEGRATKIKYLEFKGFYLSAAKGLEHRYCLRGVSAM